MSAWDTAHRQRSPSPPSPAAGQSVPPGCHINVKTVRQKFSQKENLTVPQKCSFILMGIKQLTMTSPTQSSQQLFPAKMIFGPRQPRPSVKQSAAGEPHFCTALFCAGRKSGSSGELTTDIVWSIVIKICLSLQTLFNQKIIDTIIKYVRVQTRQQVHAIIKEIKQWETCFLSTSLCIKSETCNM